MDLALPIKKLALIAILFLICSGSYGQAVQQTIKGTVTNTGGEPVENATVILKGTKLGSQTNEKGLFVFKAPRGNYTLQLSSVGYKTFQTSIKLTDSLSLKIELKKDETDLSAVNIAGKGKTQVLKESGFSVNAIDMKAYQNTTATLNQVLDQTAGVRVRQSGGLGSAYNFSINGMSGNAVKYFIDGVPIESMGGIVDLNNIPVNLAKSVEIYKGVVPTEFGADAMGGVVNIVTNSVQKSFVDASFSTGSFATQQGALSAQYFNPKNGFIIKANGFLNYAKNNYMMKDVEVFDTALNRYTAQDHPRFHDEYFSTMGMVEAGFTKKKWADQFLIGVNYSKQNNDIQNGTTQNILYGSAERQAESLTGSVKYKKDNFIVPHLNVNLFASISKNNFSVLDTAFRLYFWDGSYTVTNRAEVSGGAKSITHYDRPNATARANISYRLSDQHAFSLNYQMNRSSNESYDELSNAPVLGEDRITKQILGIAYQQSFFKGRLSNTLFAKHFGTKLKAGSLASDDYLIGDGTGATNSDWGYGFASRFKITENTGVKASYEFTYRLQEPEEILGNGYSVMANYSLKPESSRNYNLGFYIGNSSQVHHIFFEGTGFIRDAQNYIQGIFREALGMTQYQNTSSVSIKGMEGEARYAYKQLFNVSVNASYQHAINTTIAKDGSKEVTYGYKLPNRPWVFGNASFNIGQNDLLGKDTRIQLGYSSQYIHWFYLTWANFGNPDNKSAIPSQFIHNLLLSYSFKGSKYNVSFECRNLTDNLSYDNFKLQKPGRAFYLKLRYFLSN